MLNRLNQEARHGRIGWLIWACSSLFYLYQFILRISTGVMASDIMSDLQLSQTEFGIMAGGYYLTYSLMQIPLGLVSDRYDTQKILLGAISSCILGSLCLGYANSMMEAYCGRFLIGLGSSAAFLTCIKTITVWFPASYLPILGGLTVTLGTLGANIGGKLLAWVSSCFGWRCTFFYLSILGMGVLCMPAILILKTKSTLHGFQAKRNLNSLSQLKELRKLLTTPQAWVIASLYFLIYTPFSCIADTWGVSYLSDIYGISKIKSAKICLILYMGVAIGSPIMGYISNKLCSRRIILIFSTFCSILIFFYIFYAPVSSTKMIESLFFLLGFLLAGQKLVFTCISELMPKTITGASIGFINSICMLSGVVLPALMGKCLVLSSNNSSFLWFKLSGSGSYFYAFLIPGSCLVLGFIISLFIKETYPVLSKQKLRVVPINMVSRFR